MKRSIFTPLFLVGAAAIGVCIGFVVHGGRHPRASGDAGSAAALPARLEAVSQRGTDPTAAGTAQRRPTVADDSPLATQLARDLSMSEGVTRWLYWMQAIERATAGDMPRLARLATGNPIAIQLVAGRWMDLAPRQMFDTLVAWSDVGSGFSAGEWMSFLLSDWPRKDPDAVIAAMNSPQASAFRRSWRHRVAEAIFEKDVERGLKLMADWRIANYGPNTARVAAWVDADPVHAANFVIGNPAGAASQQVMQAVGKAWASNDPAGAMAFATGERSSLHRLLAESTLGEWARRDLNAAAEWLAKAEPGVRTQLSPFFLEAWGVQDPAAALAWTEANFSGPALEHAVSGLLKGAAARDLNAAAGLVASLNPSPARASAAAAVAAKWFPSYGSDKPVPAEALGWLGSLDPASVGKVIDDVGYSWAANDPRGLAKFLEGPGRAAASDSRYSDLVRSWVRLDPNETMNWAARLPEQNRIFVGEVAFREWSRWQFESAFQWLGGVSANDPRRQLYFDSAIRAVALEGDAASKFASLNSADRTAARAVVEGLPIPEPQRERLVQALKTNP